MKTKRIVALALTAAMAVSMASMTAFAEKWSQYTTHNTGNALRTVDDPSYKEDVEGYFVEYQTRKMNEAAGLNDVKEYLYRKGSTIEESTANGVTTKKYLLNTNDDTQIGNETAGLLWRNLKAASDQFGAPSMEEEDECVFMGWTVESGTVDAKDIQKTIKGDFADAANYATAKATWLPSDTSADKAKILKDDDDVIDKATKKGTTATDAIVFYPVFREKTPAEKLQSAVNIANRPKVAKPTGEKEWVYTQKDLDRTTAKVSAPYGEASSAAALAKCKAEMKHSRVFDIKPQVDGKVVDLKKGAVQEVRIPIIALYSTAQLDGGQVYGDKKKVNAAIKQGKLKVFHIGSDGKSHQVTGIKSDDDGHYVVFKSGFYSEFVLTKDPNARAQAGEEDGASGGNPATGEASTLPVAMLALAALSATGVVAYKKRKAE